jgi:hypothetical protein
VTLIRFQEKYIVWKGEDPAGTLSPDTPDGHYVFWPNGNVGLKLEDLQNVIKIVTHLDASAKSKGMEDLP